MKIIFDFDSVLNKDIPKQGVLIINNQFSGEGFINVKDHLLNRDQAFTDYLKFANHLTEDILYDFPIKGHRPELFNAVIYPLSQWLDVVDELIKNGTLNTKSHLSFTSYSKNSNVFFLEAEGESQGSLLYRPSYYLSALVYKYIKSRLSIQIHIDSDITVRSKVSFYFRGMVFISLKLFQQLFYKSFQVIKNQSNLKINSHVFMSRGIIQSQFIESFKGLFKDDSYTVLTNESAIFPLRNYRFYKKNKIDSIFVEGMIPLKLIWSTFTYTVKGYFSSIFSKSKLIYFRGMPIKANDVLPELFIHKYYSETQALCLNSIKEFIPKSSKLFCFDMLTPQPYYIKNFINNKIVQIQTTLMQGIVQDDFIYTDKFYFTDKATYNKHKKVNKHLDSKFGLLNNLKYSLIDKKPALKKVRTITFFTQPIYEEEELMMLNYLKIWAGELQLELSIKLHPRSKKSDYDHLKLKYYDSEESSIIAIQKSDLIITRNSSVGLDAWILNVPVIFLVYGNLKGSGISYIPMDYIGSFIQQPSISEFKHFIENLNNFYDHSYHTTQEVDKSQLKAELIVR